MRNKTILALTLLLLVLPALTQAQAPPRDGVRYDLIIACPEARGGQCPIRAIDGADAMGDPAIAVDPDNVDNMIIASLHGQKRGDGPTERSRSGQAYTTFTSTNHGASWRDNPFTPPQDIGSDAFGEHPGIALDPYGHVFVGSLYAIPQGERRSGPFDFVIAAQKFSSLQDINDNQGGDGSYNVAYIGPVHPGNQIVQHWFLQNPRTDNMTMVWHERVTAASHNGSSEDAPLVPLPNGSPASRVSDRLEDVLPRRPPVPQVPADPVPTRGDLPAAQPAPTRPKSVIGVAWTSADVEADYLAQPAQHAIGPCRTSTNPVLSEGWLYIGCQVADGEGSFRWRPDAAPGDIEMFRMHPDGGVPQYLGTAPIAGGAPKLGVRSDGRMAILTAEVVDVGGAPRIRLDGAYGQYDAQSGRVEWGTPHAYGNDLQVLYANTPYVDVNIQDMIYREYSGVLHIILKRVVDWPTSELLAATRPSLFKSVVAIDEHHGLLADIDLGIGDLAQRLQDPTLYGFPEAFYNDLSDDFLELPPTPHAYAGRPLGDTYQREFYAIGNYGTVDFAEVIELTDLRGPAAPPLPNPPPPPSPAPASSTSLALGMAGSLTAAALIAGTVATNKRPAVTRAGRRKKRR